MTHALLHSALGALALAVAALVVLWPVSGGSDAPKKREGRP